MRTLKQILARMTDIRGELERLDRHQQLTGPQKASWHTLIGEFEQLDDERRGLERDTDAELVRAALADGTGRVEDGVTRTGADWTGPSTLATDPWDAGERADIVTRARHAIDRCSALPEAGKERLTAALATADADNLPVLAHWAAATSDPAYARAFARMVADPATGYAEFDENERGAWRRVRDLSRAMGIGTGAGGGFMVPTHLDPAIMLTSAGSISPLRRIARVVTIGTDTWHGVSSAGVTAEWLAEAAEAADASPTLAEPIVPVHKGSAFVPFSVEWGADAADALSELGNLLVDAADQLQAAAYATGTGVGQPTGVTGLAVGSKVATLTADVLVDDDVFGLQTALPPRFQAGAQWCTNLGTANAIQQFESAAGAKTFPEISAGTLLRKPWNELSFLDEAGDTALAGNDNVALYGDFTRAFLIVDRVGTSVEIVQHLVGANRRPTGQRGAWMWFRTGSDVIVDEALRLLTA